MHVLHVLAPAPAGGLERVVTTLARAQSRRGHDVTVAAVLTPLPQRREAADPALAGLAAALADADGVTLVAMTIPGRGYWAERSGIVALATQCTAEVAHTHGYRPDVVDAGALRGAGIPTVTTVHGYTGGGLRNRLYERIQRRAFRRMNAVIAVSAPMARGLVADGVAESRVHLIPNAYDRVVPLVPRPAARAALQLREDEYVIGWVGRLSREKGLDVLLDALALVPDRALTLAVVGDGRERDALRAQAATLGIADRVRWLGLVPAAGTLVPAFDALCMSSRTEGTPIALFEAMDAEVPIIATAVGGIPDVVTAREAMLVPAPDPEQLAAAIRAVHADPEGARCRARAASARLHAVYAVEPWLDRHDAVYESVRDGSGRRVSPA